MKKIGILVDSGGIVSGDYDIQNTNIEVIPLHVILGDKTDFLDTPENIKKYDVYKRLASGENITTSMASIGELENKYDEMLKKYDEILHVTITPNLSSMKEVATMVASEDRFKDKIHIVDHYTAANGIKYMVLKFNEMLKDGIEDIKEFKKIADLATNKIFLGLIPGDISKLNKSGRTKKMLIAFLKIIKTRFIIRWSKNPENVGLSRSIKGIVKKAVDLGRQESGEGCKILLVYSEGASDETINNAKKSLDFENIDYVFEQIPSIYSCHAGSETLGIITIPNELNLK